MDLPTFDDIDPVFVAQATSIVVSVLWLVALAVRGAKKLWSHLWQPSAVVQGIIASFGPEPTVTLYDGNRGSYTGAKSLARTDPVGGVTYLSVNSAEWHSESWVRASLTRREYRDLKKHFKWLRNREVVRQYESRRKAVIA